MAGVFEPAVFFIARHGRLLAAMCTLDTKRSSLGITGREQAAEHKLVSCNDFAQISSIIDLAKQVVELTHYNGFGNINFKMAPNRVSQTRRELPAQ